jgi:hypothetical protein
LRFTFCITVEELKSKKKVMKALTLSEKFQIFEGKYGHRYRRSAPEKKS